MTKFIMVMDKEHVTDEMITRCDTIFSFDGVFSMEKNRYCCAHKHDIGSNQLGHHIVESCVSSQDNDIYYVCHDKHSMAKMWNYNGPGWYFLGSELHKKSLYGPYETYEETVNKIKEYVGWLGQ
jgi:hypothetical protein